MDIRCVNCGLEFAFDPPPFSQQQEAACPRCGHGNAVESGGSSGGMGA